MDDLTKRIVLVAVGCILVAISFFLLNHFIFHLSLSNPCGPYGPPCNNTVFNAGDSW